MSYPNLATSGMIQQELTQRFAGIGSTMLAVSSFGASGDPLVKCAITTGAAASQCALLRFTTRPSLFLDAVGNAQQVYAPALLQIAVEDSTINGTPYLNLVNQVVIYGTAFRYGNQIEFWSVTQGNAVIESAFAGTNAALKAVWDASLKYGAQASI